MPESISDQPKAPGQEHIPYIRDAVHRFQRQNVQLGSSPMPVASLMKGLTSNTGLSEAEISVLLEEMGIHLAQTEVPVALRKRSRGVSPTRLDQFVEALEEEPDKREEGYTFSAWTDLRLPRF